MNADWLDQQIFPGFSAFFVLLFFGPLGVLVTIALLFAERVIRWGKALTLTWLFACVPAGFFMLMGYAFNPRGLNPVFQILLWALAGMAVIWFPLTVKLAMQALFTQRNGSKTGSTDPRA